MPSRTNSSGFVSMLFVLNSISIVWLQTGGLLLSRKKTKRVKVKISSSENEQYFVSHLIDLHISRFGLGTSMSVWLRLTFSMNEWAELNCRSMIDSLLSCCLEQTEAARSLWRTPTPPVLWLRLWENFFFHPFLQLSVYLKAVLTCCLSGLLCDNFF